MRRWLARSRSSWRTCSFSQRYPAPAGEAQGGALQSPRLQTSTLPDDLADGFPMHSGPAAGQGGGPRFPGRRAKPAGPRPGALRGGQVGACSPGSPAPPVCRLQGSRGWQVLGQRLLRALRGSAEAWLMPDLIAYNAAISVHRRARGQGGPWSSSMRRRRQMPEADTYNASISAR